MPSLEELKALSGYPITRRIYELDKLWPLVIAELQAWRSVHDKAYITGRHSAAYFDLEVDAISARKALEEA